MKKIILMISVFMALLSIPSFSVEARHQYTNDDQQHESEVDVVAVDLKAAMGEDVIDVGATEKLIDQKYDVNEKIA